MSVIEPSPYLDPREMPGAGCVIPSPIQTPIRLIKGAVVGVKGAADSAVDKVESAVGEVLHKAGALSTAHGCKPTPVSSHSLIALVTKVYSLSKKALAAIPYSLSSASSSLSKFDFRIFGVASHGLGALFLPLSLRSLAKAPTNVYDASSPRERTNAVLEGVEAAAGVAGWLTASFGMLYEFGLIAKELVTWTSVASPLLSGLGVVSVAINALGMDDAYMVKDQLDRSLGALPKETIDGTEVYDLEALRRALEMIRDGDAKLLKKQFKVSYDISKDAEVALERLHSGDVEARKEASRLVDQLRARLNSKMTSHALKMLSSSVSLIALPLILSGPAATLGVVLATSSAVLSLITLLHDLRVFTPEPIRFERSKCEMRNIEYLSYS